MAIEIRVVAGENEAASSVEATGTEQHVITDTERTTFKLSDSQLKDAVEKYFGRRPTDAYVRSPTPWDDLYKTYGWQQVTTILKVTNAQILGLETQPTIVKTQEFRNESSKRATFDVSISEQVQNSSSSTWSVGGELSIGQKITYGIDFIVKGSGETSLNYSQNWGVGGTYSDSVTLGSTSGITVDLDPNEAVVVELTASRGSLRVKLDYDAYLTGYTACNYYPPYNDHYFWALPIDEVMEAAGIKNSVPSTEELKIGYYSDSKIVVKDALGRQRASFLV